MKQLKIKEYKFNGDKIIKIKRRRKDDDIKGLDQRLAKLEIEVKDLFNDINKLTPTTTPSSSTSYEEDIESDYSRIIEIKKYLIWVCKQLRSLKCSEGFCYSTASSEIDTSSISSYDEIENQIDKLILIKGSQSISLRNRAGRSAEHVGDGLSCVDYGNFLENGLHLFSCGVFGSSGSFSEPEVLKYINTSNPGFISFTLMASLTIPQNKNNILGYDDIFMKTYKDSLKLVYEAYQEINFDNLRGLLLLTEFASCVADVQNVLHIFPSLLRMAYSLGINKIDLSTEIAFKSEEEIRRLIKMKKTWHSLVQFVLFAEMFYKISPSYLVNFNYDSSEFDILKDLDEKYLGIYNNSLKRSKVITTSIRLCISKLSYAISNHIKIILNKSRKYDLTYSERRLPHQLYLDLQKSIDIYHKSSFSYFVQEMNRQANATKYSVKHYVCTFPTDVCNQHTSFYGLKYSMIFYHYQLLTIDPLHDMDPRQLDLPLKEALIMLETSLKLNGIFLALSYHHFENVLFRLNQKVTCMSQCMIEQLSDYLNSHPKPEFGHEAAGLIYWAYMTTQLYTGLTTVLGFMQTLCSSAFQMSQYNNLGVINFVRNQILKALEVINLVSKFEDSRDRLDYDQVIEKLISGVKRFTLPKGSEIPWSDYLILD